MMDMAEMQEKVRRLEIDVKSLRAVSDENDGRIASIADGFKILTLFTLFTLVIALLGVIF